MSKSWALAAPAKASTNKSERKRRIDLPIVQIKFSSPKIQKFHLIAHKENSKIGVYPPKRLGNDNFSQKQSKPQQKFTLSVLFRHF